jgi:AcrR family transcriptional regulator
MALAMANAEAMQIEDHLEREGALRMKRIADVAARALRRDGVDPLAARVLGGAYGAAVLAAISSWASSGAGSAPLEAHLDRALAVLEESAR